MIVLADNILHGKSPADSSGGSWRRERKKHKFEDKHLSQIDGIPKDPQRGKPFSRWEFLRSIRRSMASLSTDDQ